MTAFQKSKTAEDHEEELKEVYELLEMIEAITTDKKTANKIRLFLQKKGIWKK